MQRDGGRHRGSGGAGGSAALVCSGRTKQGHQLNHIWRKERAGMFSRKEAWHVCISRFVLQKTTGKQPLSLML